MIKSITDYLDITCNKYPEKIAFAENENVFITYKDFVLKSKVIGSNIVEEYNLFKMPIMVFIDKSINTLLSMFGVLYSGNFYTVVDVTTPKNRKDSILNTLEPKLIITDNKNIEKEKFITQVIMAGIKINLTLPTPVYLGPYVVAIIMMTHVLVCLPLTMIWGTTITAIQLVS